MQRYLFIFLVGVIGLTMTLSGCAKRVTTEPTSEVMEEEGTMPAETEEDMADAPVMEEEEVVVEEESISEPSKESMGVTDIYFDYDKFNVRADMKSAMESNAKWLKANPKVSATIEGHADSRGTEEYNLALGERRAQATKRFLMALGVKEGQISTISYGEERSVCMQESEGCYSKNRRAHFAVRGK